MYPIPGFDFWQYIVYGLLAGSLAGIASVGWNAAQYFMDKRFRVKRARYENTEFGGRAAESFARAAGAMAEQNRLLQEQNALLIKQKGEIEEQNHLLRHENEELKNANALLAVENERLKSQNILLRRWSELLCGQIQSLHGTPIPMPNVDNQVGV